ncbi:MAG: SDR family oxidoreductase [Opitutaceae bacterium]
MSTRHFEIVAMGGEGGGESAATVRTIVITAGTKGLGSAAAKAFFSRGDRVWILSRNKPSTEDSHPNLKHLVADVRHRDQLEAAVAAIRTESSVIDVWINNAGFGKPVPFHDVGNALWDDMLGVNFWGTVHGTRAALGALRRPGGAIVNIASVAGLISPRSHSAYATAHNRWF